MAGEKAQLVEQLVPLIENEILIIQRSLDSASEAATHPESKPENKYDTRGLEASYLAGAQRERLLELKSALVFLRSMTLRDFAEEDRIAPTAVVVVENEERKSWYFILPFGAGFNLQWGDRPVVVLTPYAPLGKVLLNKMVGDSIKVRTGTLVKEYEILQVF